MPWFSDPQRDSRDDVRTAQQALVYAGYPHSAAVAEYETYLYRVRAALAAPRDIVWAGFLVGAAMAVVGLAALILLAVLGGIVASLVEAPLVPAESAAPAPAGPARGSPFDFLPTILVTTWVLGMAGAGIALVTRNRWRRARVLETFIDVAPRRVYLLETAAVWLAVAALIVVVVWAQAGSQMAGNSVALLAFFGIPILALVFGAGFPGLYNRLLPRVSPLDAAAYARPIIENEAALQVKSEREFYGRPAYERNRWAEEVLALSEVFRGRPPPPTGRTPCAESPSPTCTAPRWASGCGATRCSPAAGRWSAGSSPAGCCGPTTQESRAGTSPEGATPQTSRRCRQAWEPTSQD